MLRTLLTSILILSLVFSVAVWSKTPPKPIKPGEGGAPRFPDSLPYWRHDIRNPSNAIVTLETDSGKLTLELYRDVSPAHADSFLARCGDGFYDSTRFHRIIKDFMIQGGSPFHVGKKSVDYYLPNELNSLPHKFGTLSMASRGEPTTAQTQFFICTDRNAKTQYLDGKYVVFGQLLKGFDVLWAISRVPVEPVSKAPGAEKSLPTKDVWLIKAYRSDAEGNPLK
ncbi:MAG: peptidylprolyl isomerase [Candidatus Zixiibacteriota bacterium]